MHALSWERKNTWDVNLAVKDPSEVPHWFQQAIYASRSCRSRSQPYTINLTETAVLQWLPVHMAIFLPGNVAQIRLRIFAYFSNSPAGILSLLDNQKCWTEGHCLANKSSLHCTCHEAGVAGMFITQALSYPADGLYRCSKSALS